MIYGYKGNAKVKLYLSKGIYDFLNRVKTEYSLDKAMNTGMMRIS